MSSGMCGLFLGAMPLVKTDQLGSKVVTRRSVDALGQRIDAALGAVASRRHPNFGPAARFEVGNE